MKYDVYIIDEKDLRWIWAGRHLEETLTAFINRNCTNGLRIGLRPVDSLQA